MKKVWFVVLIGLLVANVNTFAGTPGANDKFVGKWEYKNNYDLPYEYQSGKVNIFEKGGQLKAKVEMEYVTLDIDKITVKEGVLSFSLYVDGSYVEVTLKPKDAKLVGTVNADGMDIPLTLVKQK